MPSEHRQREEYNRDFLPEISTYDIRIEVKIYNGVELSFKEMKALLAADILNGYPYRKETTTFPTINPDIDNSYLTSVIASYFTFRINGSLKRNSKAYLANCRDREGSYILLASMILEAMVDYNHLREALARIQEDLESTHIGNFHVTHAFITPRNTAAARIAHQHLALARRKAMTTRIMSIVVPIVFCATGAGIIFYAKVEEQEESKKIEVTINPKGAVPVSIEQDASLVNSIPTKTANGSPTMDSVSAKPAKHR